MIPRIIHQSYKNSDHPYPKSWQRSWISDHPDWDYRFHTDKENRRLVQKHFPQFLKDYDTFPMGIMRADFLRFIYLYLWGGIYVDLDYVCLRPFDGLLDQIPRLGIPKIPQNTHYGYHNALLISEAGHWFWRKCIHQAIAYFRSANRLGNRVHVETLAGPMRLQAVIRSNRPKFVALQPGLVTPIDWFTYNPKIGLGDQKMWAFRCKLRDAPIETMRQAFPDAYAVTFWDHGWGFQGPNITGKNPYEWFDEKCRTAKAGKVQPVATHPTNLQARRAKRK